MRSLKQFHPFFNLNVGWFRSIQPSGENGLVNLGWQDESGPAQGYLQ